MGMLRKVVDGQIIIPDQYKQMEADDEDEEELEEEDNARRGTRRAMAKATVDSCSDHLSMRAIL
ncbi:hypothetical protein A2U01_0041210, partial [Trifolium medium]|nr:hypothetical protein [Trifolium medium]